MIQFSRGRLYIAMVVSVLLTVNIVALHWSSGLFRASQHRILLRYGGRLPKIKGQSLVGQRTIELSPNLHNLILYFSSATSSGVPIELIKYGEILTQRFGKKGIKVTAILPGEVPELRGLIERSLINYDLIRDEDRQIADKLGLEGKENGVFLFDDQGLCRFATRRPINANDLQQLVAVDFLHVDPFEHSAVPEQSIQQGKKLGSWSMIDVRSWERTSLARIRSGAPSLFVFFTAECSVCALPDYLEEFKKYEQRQQSETGVERVLIFDFNFSIENLIEQLNAHHINTPAYIANEQLPAVHEMVQGEALKNETVIAVGTGKNGTVKDISSIRALAAGRGDVGTTSPERQQGFLAADGSYEKVFSDIPFSGYDVASYKGKYILSDFKGHRVFIVNDKMQVETEFGRIGSGPGHLFHPGCLDVAGDGTIYVQDGGNERIEKFTLDGKHLGDLPMTDYEGFAVGVKNELFLGQPEEGHLITVYSGAGNKLRAFGRLKKISEIYGSSFAERDEQYRIAFNRVRLSTDAEGNLYVSFMLAPLLQKYNAAGDLMFELRLEDPEIDRLVTAIRKRKYVGTGADGVDARIVAVDPVIEPNTGNIIVPLIDGSIYVADRNGRKLKFLRPQPIQPTEDSFYPFAAGLGAKGELLVSPFPRKQWYRLVPPTYNAGRVTAASESKGFSGRGR